MRHKPFLKRPVETDAELDAIWAPKLEPVTPAIRAELVGRGWNAQQIDQLAAEGWQYNRARDSLMLPDVTFDGKW